MISLGLIDATRSNHEGVIDTAHPSPLHHFMKK
jgi:hypothetical protein